MNYKNLISLLLLLSGTMASFAQSPVQGRVIDKKARPIEGVSVVLKDQKVGTITDSLGLFTIPAQKGDTLQFIWGRKTRLILLDTLNKLQIQLDRYPKNEALRYGLFEHPIPTTAFGAFEKIDHTDFNPVHITDPAQLVQGQLGGLLLSRPDGDPTMPFDLRLRGFTSFFQSHAPMILVDGIPEVNLSFLDPQEIASVTIVKDLATAAFYGFRAGNGLIAIQTHQPESQSLAVQYQTYGAFSSAAQTVDVLSAPRYRSLGSNSTFFISDQGFDTDWQEEILRDVAFSNSHHLSFSGTNSGFSYRAALSYRDMQGVVQKSGYQQLGGRLFVGYKGWQNRIRITSNTFITQRDIQNFDYDFASSIRGGRRNAPIIYAIQSNPTIPVWENNDPDGGIYAPNQTLFAENPLSRLNQTINDQKQNYVVHSNTIAVRLTEGLTARGRYGLIYQQYTHGFQADPNAVISVENALAANSGALRKALQRQHWLDGQVQYQGQWKNHILQAVAGYSYQYNRQGNQLYTAISLPNADFSYRNLNDAGQFPDGFTPNIEGEQSSRTLSSYYASLGHQYGGWSFAGNFRFEGASNLGREARWHRYFGLTGGYDFATLWGNFPLITQLRLRVGYGTAANLPRESYLSQALIGEPGQFTVFDGEFIPVTDIIQVGNPNLKPESSREYNIGVDATLFNGRLRGSLDIFSKRTSNIITTQTILVPSIGGRRQYINVGELANFGADGHLIMDVIQKEGFRWQLGFRGSVHKQRIDQLNTFPFNASNHIMAGFAGLFPVSGIRNIFFHEEDSNFGSFIGPQFLNVNESGQWNFRDLNNDGQYCFCRNDHTFLGNAYPDFVFGFSNQFQIGQLDISFQLSGAFGHSILNNHRLIFENPISSFTSNMLSSVLDPIPSRLAVGGELSDFYLEKGDYIIIDYISIGYRFSKKLRVYTSLNRWFTFTNYSGLSPEVRYSFENDQLAPGIEGPSSYYPERSFLLGLELRL